MQLSACITTRSRTQELDACLYALWNSSVKPYSVIVSDDSSNSEVRQKNCQIVECYPGTTYLTGPRSGVCANRNHAIDAIIKSETDLISFIDDDICVDPNFIACALEQYTQILPYWRNCTILSGVSRDESGHESSPTRLSFRGYFCLSDIPQAVNLHAAVFPRTLFEIEQWDMNIFFGYEDAELCLRALKQGYRILHCPELKVFDTRPGKSPLKIEKIGNLTDYEIYREAARLYVGIKRYKDLYPNPFRLVAFLVVYFSHMTIYLLRQRALKAWPKIIHRSHIQQLCQQSDSQESR